MVQLTENDRENSTASHNGSALPFYADNVRDFPEQAMKAGTLIIKTHRPSTAMEFLTRYARGSVFITVREPRDAIASLMQRFNHRFDACLGEVAVNARRLVDLLENGGAKVFRYEERFYDRPETLERLASSLGLPVQAQARRRIFRALTATSVEKRINALSAGGAFGRKPTPDSFDVRTHWHPGHIGDRRIGKYRAVLTLDMQKRILAAMRDYCAAFGYPVELSEDGAAPRVRSRRRDRLARAIPIA